MAENLPIERLARILGYIVDHEPYWDNHKPGDEFSQAKARLKESHKKSTQQLARVCRVSRRCYALAKPILYRHVRLFDDDVKRFVRTMACCYYPKQLDLTIRSLVRSVSFEFEVETGIGLQPSDDDRWSMRRCFEECVGALGTYCSPGGYAEALHR